MARKIRLEYAGATSHHLARGNRGGDLYADDRDRALWLQTLGGSVRKDRLADSGLGGDGFVVPKSIRLHSRSRGDMLQAWQR